MNNNTNSAGVFIAGLHIENVKRVRAVQMIPAPHGLTIIGGDNGQGKTSVLDAIAGALGGDSFKQPVHEGASRGFSRVTLSNGLVVERIYTAAGGSRLKVDDPTGKKSGQSLLSELVSQFALNVGEFMAAGDKKKGEILLKVIGVNPQPFEERIRTLEADRLIKGREADRMKGHAESLPYYEDAPEERLDGNSISAKMTEALQFNAKVRAAGVNAGAKKDALDLAEIRHREAEAALVAAQERVDAANARMVTARGEYQDALANAGSVGKPVDTEAISAKLAEVSETNEKVQANLNRKQAQETAAMLSAEYAEIQKEITEEREALKALLEGAELPYPGLGVNDGVLQYNGRAWSTLSESEKLILATAISRAVNPNCRFVLVDGLERMDRKTLATFSGWLVTQGLQAIGTRVGNGEECSLIIENGVVAGSEEPAAAPETKETGDMFD